jgi:hypothetical protein
VATIVVEAVDPIGRRQETLWIAPSDKGLVRPSQVLLSGRSADLLENLFVASTEDIDDGGIQPLVQLERMPGRSEDRALKLTAVLLRQSVEDLPPRSLSIDITRKAPARQKSGAFDLNWHPLRVAYTMIRGTGGGQR